MLQQEAQLYETLRKDVFTINDIDLIIPPANINVQKEDLVYQWKTLRSKSSTKIPSGHGQIAVQLVSVFTGDQVFDLHRLIVEFRHSPFCFIENRFLRESIVPEWAKSQNMAYTMTSINVSPLPNSSDTWVMQLELTWFNYAPYVHNFLFREDWMTDWLYREDGRRTSEKVRMTIGWDLDESFERKYRPNIVARSSNPLDVEEGRDVAHHREWSVVQEEYANNRSRTLEDMEEAHRGEIFDLLPLPDKMTPARFVAEPVQSRIYVRFINYLQRDALLKNFDIDVEADLRAAGIADYFFGAARDKDNNLVTWPLHRPQNNVHRRLLSSWISQMVSYHGGARFVFATYKDIRLPNEWQRQLSDLYSRSAERYSTGSSANRSDHFIGVKDDSGEITAWMRRRPGWSRPHGKHSPLGDLAGTPIPFTRLLGSFVSSTPVNFRDTFGRVHWGIDLAAPVGSAVFAVAPGRIQRIVDEQNGGDTWWHVDTSLGIRQPIDSYQLQTEWENAVVAAYPQYADRIVNLHVNGPIPVGTVLANPTRANSYFYNEFKAGGIRIQMAHDDGATGFYMHLDSISPEAYEAYRTGRQITQSEIEQSFKLGTVGTTSTLSESFVLSSITDQDILDAAQAAASGRNTATQPRIPWYLESNRGDAIYSGSTGPHLHIEYWEPLEVPGVEIPPWPEDDKLHLARSQTAGVAYKDRIAVDITASFSMAGPGDYIIRLDQELTPPTIDEVQDRVDQLEGYPEDQREALKELFARLFEDDWFYYDLDEDVTNVWWKHWILNVRRGNAEDLRKRDDRFVSDQVVNTTVAGGLRNVVASIPILGQEFPTQQHLGSIEPYYVFEFCSIDKADDNRGLSQDAQMLEGMRSVLQHNARRFRPIRDSWCVLGESFITRLLGTYVENDFLVGEVPTEEEQVVSDLELKRRLVITRASSETVEGNPGLTCHTYEMSETNPYEEEKLTANAPGLEVTEEARQRVLKALMDLDVVERYQPLLSLILLAQVSGANLSDLNREDFGHVSYMELSEYSSEDPYSTTFLYYNGVDERIILPDEDGHLRRLAEAGVFDGNLLPVYVPEEDGYIVIGASELQNNVGEFVSRDANGELIRADFRFDRATWQRGARVTYDISSYLTESQDLLLLAEIPLEEILVYRELVDRLLISAELTISEPLEYLISGVISGTPLDAGYVNEELYSLGIDPSLWRGAEYYLRLGAAETAPAGFGATAVDILESNPNWLEWAPNHQISQQLSSYIDRHEGEVSYFTWSTYIKNTVTRHTTDNISLGLTSVFDIAALPFEAPHQAIESVTGVQGLAREANGITDPLRGLRSYTESRIQEANGIVVSGYVDMLPVSLLKADEYIRSTVGESVVGPIFGSLEDANELPLFTTVTGQLTDSVLSCGYWQQRAVDAFPRFIIHRDFDYTAYNRTIQDFNGGQVDDSGSFLSNLAGTETVGPTTALNDQGNGLEVLTGEPLSTSWGTIDSLRAPGSPFVWKVDRQAELAKVRYFKNSLARIANELINSPRILRAFGLEELNELQTNSFVKGTHAYPDMDLPFHPYYGNYFTVSPDFYMWNIYQDGQALNSTVRDSISSSIDAVVTNCYNSLRRLQTGEDYSPSRDSLVQEPQVEADFTIIQRFNAEGTDGNYDGSDQSATAIPFYEDETDAESISNFLTRLDGSTRSQVSNQRPPGVRLSLTEGPYGQGGGIQYPNRVTNAAYEELKDYVESTKPMFGHRAGYLDQEEDSQVIRRQNELFGTIGVSKPAHRFDEANIKLLAKQSSNDIISQKMMMRRAYPTFKLYFVEEDEFETRLLNFDDFYSYNGVVSFTVVRNRKDPADHAVITVQNVGGTLDGTKRNATVDLDYFSRDADQAIEITQTRLGLDPVTQGTDQDQPFGAVVLRPGLNIQLRAGYSNDPSQLEVLISGRVVDVQWNKQGDTAELMVQSFGTELIQSIKGTNPASDPATFYTTHQLLGSMMLEPELVHFGRWEFGRLLQVGEGKDSSLDFFDYSREGWLGRFRYSRGAVRWLLDHPLITFGLATAGLSTISRLPGAGRVVGWITRNRYLGNALARRGVTGAISRATFRRAIEREAVNGRVTNAAAQAALRSLAPRIGLLQTAAQAIGGRVPAAIRAATVNMHKIINQGGTLDDVAQALYKTHADARTLISLAPFLKDPTFSSTIVQTVGFKPFTSIGLRFLKNTPRLLLAAAGLGLGLDAMSALLDPIHDATIGRAQRYFRTTQASLMLSPQDDNLYCPHPKDYMLLGDKGIRQLAQDLAWWGLKSGVTALFVDDDLGYEAVRFFKSDWLDKRSEPQTWQYNVLGSTVWDIFHEASLRHPGWVYGARPYGTEFRYTMFFGVPSQRYWARGASNEFIARSNDVFAALDQGIEFDEYRKLYGDITPSGFTLDEIRDLIRHEVTTGSVSEVDYTTYFYEPEQLARIGETNLDGTSLEGPYASPSYPTPFGDVEDVVNSTLHNVMTARALEEYLRGLQLRFVPFRRYHVVTSERDIVWNGLMSSENAVYNAVDVTYFNEHDTSKTEPPAAVASALFKAHWSTPDYKLRIMPLQPYRNCRGYQMAMRYGMGQLLHNMRDMYRGEILTVGNSRVRPWDVCIVIDTYNDMVGPVEVEQVVDTFSYETGWLTEIKPSALVIANEISSWPVLEAMKVASLAMKDVEESFVGLRPDDLGSTTKIIDWLIGVAGSSGEPNENWQNAMAKRSSELFGEDFSPSEDLFGGEPPNLEPVTDLASNIATGVFAAGALASGAAAYKAGGWIFKALGNESVLLRIAAGAGAASTVAGFGAATVGVINQFDPPHLIWLLGGPLLMLNALRGDTVMVVPLIKNGYPIVSGINTHDPSAVWSNFKGNLGRWADDLVTGTRDMLDLWRLYGIHAWKHIPNEPNVRSEFLTRRSFDEAQAQVDLTGDL